MENIWAKCGHFREEDNKNQWDVRQKWRVCAKSSVTWCILGSWKDGFLKTKNLERAFVVTRCPQITLHHFKSALCKVHVHLTQMWPPYSETKWVGRWQDVWGVEEEEEGGVHFLVHALLSLSINSLLRYHALPRPKSNPLSPPCFLTPCIHASFHPSAWG